MFGALEEWSKQELTRDLVFVSLALVVVLVPALFEIGFAAWIAMGCLLAFAAVHPRALVFAVPFAIAFAFSPFTLGPLQFNILEILVVFAFVGYGPRVAWSIWKARHSSLESWRSMARITVPDYLAAGIGILLMAGAAISTVWMASPDHLAESLRTFRWTVLIPLMYFFMAAPVIHLRSFNRTLAGGLFVAGALLAAGIALLDGLAGGGIEADAVTRLSGLASHPNSLALVLDRAAVFGLIMAVLVHREIERRWALPAAFVMLVALLTFSRGAILGMIAGFLLVATLARMKALAITGVAVSGALLGVLTAVAPERTMSLLGGGSGSLRLELWSSSVQMIRDNPLTGVGLDQFLYVYTPRYVTPHAWPERFTSHPHNIVLDSWLSLGIIGVVVVGLTVALWVRHVRTGLRLGDRVTLASAGALATVFVHGMVDHSYFLPELAMSAWLLILLLTPPPRGVDAAPTESFPPESKG